MVRLLVSVRNAAEALEAIVAGAHLIDVKEPRRGPLGSADAATMEEVLAAVAGRCPVSVALGELAAACSPQVVPAGIRFAKLGLSRCAALPNWPSAWATVLEKLPSQTAAVAVAYADHRAAQAPAPVEVLHVGRQLGCRALLIDTYDKRLGGLFDHLPAEALSQLVARARLSGLVTVLAGSLDERSFEQAALLDPDYLAVRGAVCRGGRKGILDGARVQRYVARLSGDGGRSAGALASLDSRSRPLDTGPEMD